MNEIQDEAYSEACQEIYRLTTEVQRADRIADNLRCEVERLEKELNFYCDMAAQADAACIRLKALCQRAAEALEGRPIYDALANYNLIIKLREVAQ